MLWSIIVAEVMRRLCNIASAIFEGVLLDPFAVV